MQFIFKKVCQSDYYVQAKEKKKHTERRFMGKAFHLRFYLSSCAKLAGELYNYSAFANKINLLQVCTWSPLHTCILWRMERKDVRVLFHPTVKPLFQKRSIFKYNRCGLPWTIVPSSILKDRETSQHGATESRDNIPQLCGPTWGPGLKLPRTGIKTQDADMEIEEGLLYMLLSINYCFLTCPTRRPELKMYHFLD